MKIVYEDLYEYEWAVRRCYIAKQEGMCGFCPLNYVACPDEDDSERWISIATIPSEVIDRTNYIKQGETENGEF